MPSHNADFHRWIWRHKIIMSVILVDHTPVQTDYNHVIRLTIDELALTSSNTCEQEYVEISDGTTHWVTRLDKLCPHFRGGQQYTSTDSSMSIFYYSEKPFSSRDARFRFSIMALPRT
ncbi:hypothetical protein BaRGS_00039831, partial [Batillaria attramentaria]